MLTDDKQYEHVSLQVRYHNDKIEGSFNPFIRLFSAVVAGAIWLSLQPGVARRAAQYALLSNLLVGPYRRKLRSQTKHQLFKNFFVASLGA